MFEIVCLDQWGCMVASFVVNDAISNRELATLANDYRYPSVWVWELGKPRIKSKSTASAHLSNRRIMQNVA